MFITIVLLLLVLEFVFYAMFTRFYVQQIADDMIHRGHSHANALQADWSENMLRHVAEMESYSRYTVAVIDVRGEVLVSSAQLDMVQTQFLNGYESQLEYEWVQRDWRRQPYLISQSPIILADGETAGHVMMFTSTAPIRDALQSFQALLLLFTLISILSVFFFIFLFSNWISKPLVAMKDAIYQLTRNDYRFDLPVKSDDEIGELNRSIMDLSAELKHYRTERQEFLAEISHELRTPITFIRGYSEVLQNPQLKDEDKQKYLRFIHDAAGRLHRLIDDLYELMKLDQVQVQIKKMDVDLTQLLSQIAEENEDRFQVSEISFHVELPSVPLWIVADPSRMVQVIVNMLENSRKYTPRGGSVTLTLTSKKSQAIIEIRDTGIGIPKDQLALIWRRFYRVEKSRSRDHGGAGLGLSIARRIVELHQGTIEVISEEGKGTTFTIRIPLREPLN
ncbi:sensor histidine kinase [Cohnella algarum]|uniref:sensor histidine kinase n=1 Tax=Cohnella algarum TaxID=2044859 RepID=UPI0019676561|nr:ATP-binding protein [Cohnella algarum]MBN2981759.1 HAMP domain-containing protein [Cohnella algarum]